jgi:hypothetical protein
MGTEGLTDLLGFQIDLIVLNLMLPVRKPILLKKKSPGGYSLPLNNSSAIWKRVPGMVFAPAAPFTDYA